METIPYDETRNYTKRVLASYFTYSWLYDRKPVPKLPLEARVQLHDGDDKTKPAKAEKGDRAGRTVTSRH